MEKRAPGILINPLFRRTVSTTIPEIIDLDDDLHMVTLSDLPEGMVGAALVDANGTEIERIVAPAAHFDADAVFRRLDSRRQELAAHLERLSGALAHGPEGSAFAALRELGWHLPGLAWTAVPFAAALVQAELLSRGGWGDDTIIFMVIEVMLLAVALGAVTEADARPGFYLLSLLYLAAAVAGVVMFVLGATALGGMWPVFSYSVIAAFVTLVGATLVQVLVVWFRYDRALPFPGVGTVDLSSEPATSDAEPLLCTVRYGTRPVPCLAVRHLTEAGEPALYTLLPLRRLRRAPVSTTAALARHALRQAAREQRDARLAAEASERLGALEQSMRELG